MASMMDGSKEDEARPIVVEQKEEPAYCMTIKEDEEKNGEGEWYLDILQYLNDGTYLKSADKNDQLTIRRMSTNYIICGERLYRRSYDGIHLLYVTAKEAQQIIEKIHESSYRPHMNAHMLSRKIMRQVLESEIPEADWLQSRYDQLCMLDEKRLKALYYIQGYQRRLRKSFDKKVRTRDLKFGGLVLKEIRALVQDVNRKFKQNWVGSYIIKQIYSERVVRLMDLDANSFTEPTDMDQLKKYHV
nr:uncharacterized protein LOC112007300 [Quercus suber]